SRHWSSVVCSSDLADLPRASYSMSGFFFCGRAEDHVVKASEKVTHQNSEVAQRISSSARRERSTIAWAQQKPYSEAKSRAATASSEFEKCASHPIASALRAGSSPSDDPPDAEAPRGEDRKSTR